MVSLAFPKCLQGKGVNIFQSSKSWLFPVMPWSFRISRGNQSDSKKAHAELVDQTWSTILYAKIKEENWVSFATLSLGVDLRMSLSNYLFLTSPMLMKLSEVVTFTRISRLPVMARKQRFLCEEPLLLGQLGIMLRRR
jgi:hypothetical protein